MKHFLEQKYTFLTFHNNASQWIWAVFVYTWVVQNKKKKTIKAMKNAGKLTEIKSVFSAFGTTSIPICIQSVQDRVF